MKRNTIKLNRFSYETDIEPVSPNIAEILKQEFNLTANDVRYHVDGTYYHNVTEFPAILFDLYGYIILNSQTENRNIIFTKTINARMGISNLPEYKQYHHTPKCLAECYSNIKIATEKKNATENAKFEAMKAIMRNAMNKKTS